MYLVKVLILLIHPSKKRKESTLCAFWSNSGGYDQGTVHFIREKTAKNVRSFVTILSDEAPPLQPSTPLPWSAEQPTTPPQTHRPARDPSGWSHWPSPRPPSRLSVKKTNPTRIMRPCDESIYPQTVWFIESYISADTNS